MDEQQTTTHNPTVSKREVEKVCPKEEKETIEVYYMWMGEIEGRQSSDVLLLQFSSLVILGQLL